LADAHTIEEKDSGVSFEWQGEKIKSVFPGTFNVYNMLAAATFSHKALGVLPKTISDALSKLVSIRGRMERVSITTNGNETFPSYPVIVDYAHTEDSLRKVYEALPNHQKICVLGGTGGGRDKWKRPLMGGVAVEYCKEIILTDEDPYDEDPLLIIDDIKRGIDTANKDRAKNGMAIVPCEVILDRRRAIAAALTDAKTGDVVVITGKGTDPYIMGADGLQTPWDDAQVVREELTELLKTHGAHFTPVEKEAPLKQHPH
jgi:UDP-N-acetylmuramyl tripeptide synthase